MTKEKKKEDVVENTKKEETAEIMEIVEKRKLLPNFLLDNSGRINGMSPIIAGFKIWILQKENKRMFDIFYTDTEWDSLIKKYKNEPIGEGRKN